MLLCVVLFSALAAVWSPTVSAAPDKIVCYHGTWSYWREGDGKFGTGDIDTNLCTHIIYAFGGINGDGTIRFTTDDLEWPGFLNEYKNLKLKNPQTKTLLAVGGWNEGTINFSIVAANADLRKKLLANAIYLIQTYKFDGFDFDWEYPGGGDKENFVKLLEEFRKEFDKYGYLLTAAVSANTGYYNVPGIEKSLHFINVMTYDFYGAWNSATGHHSSFPDSINSLNSWKSAGVRAEKLVFGIGTYGRSFTLANSNNNRIGAPAIGAGISGRFTGENGSLGYSEICEKLKIEGWTEVWSDALSAPYAFGGNQWVGYDNPRSIAIKVAYVVANGFGGIMIWSVETDDFKGICGPRYPLLNAIKIALNLPDPKVPVEDPADPDPPAKTDPPSTQVTDPPPTQVTDPPPPVITNPPSNGTDLCNGEEYVRDPVNCNKFYYCQPVGGSYNPLPLYCPANLYYDPKIKGCDWPDLVPCP